MDNPRSRKSIKNSECPHCNENSFKREPFGKFILVDSDAFNEHRRKGHSIRVKVYTCNNCGFIKLFK